MRISSWLGGPPGGAIRKRVSIRTGSSAMGTSVRSPARRPFKASSSSVARAAASSRARAACCCAAAAALATRKRDSFSYTSTAAVASAVRCGASSGHGQLALPIENCARLLELSKLLQKHQYRRLAWPSHLRDLLLQLGNLCVQLP
jgi:hypothetical protein